MTKNSRLLDNLIITLTFALLVFHTFTFLQLQYSFYVTMCLFMLILCLSFIRENATIKTNDISSLIFLGFAIFLIVIAATLIKGQGLVYAVGAYSPYIMWPILYRIIQNVFDESSKRKFLIVFLLFFVVSVIATLIVVVSDNDAARLLAGSASEEVRKSYYAKGVGGYGFIYGSVFLLFGIISWRRQEQNAFVKGFILVLTILTFIMIVFASYTIAILMALLIFMLSAYTKASDKKYTKELFIFLAIIIVLLLNPILSFMRDIAQSLNLQWVYNRIGQILNNDLGELRRVQLYKQSLDSFFTNILIGEGKTGGHSMFFDLLGDYGLFGLIFSIAYLNYLINVMKKTSGKKALVFVLIIVLAFINTTNTIVLLPMILFVLPLTLSMNKVGEK